MNRFIEIIMNYVVAPILVVLFFIWQILSKIFKDVVGHIYGKILVPLIAILIIAYLISKFLK
jgi:hypothetical protein